MNAIEHAPSCLSIYWTAICFCFINQPCALYTAFDKCIYVSDVVVVKLLYKCIFNSYKEQFAFQVHALWITMKFDFWGTLGGFMGCSLVKSACFRVLRYKADRTVRPDVTFKNTSVLLVTDNQKSKQFMLAVFAKSVILRMKVSFLQQEWNNCIVSSTHLSIQFDWRNFALALAVQISIAELHLQL